MKRPTTAVIPIGGLATRFLPVAKAVNKCLLPVNSRPVIDYIVDDCLAAGLSRVILVTHEGDTQTPAYFSDNPQLRRELARRDQQGLYDRLIEPIPQRIETIIIEQAWGTPAGTAAALSWAQTHLTPNEPFAFTMGDSFLWSGSGRHDFAALIDTFQESDAAAAIMLKRGRSFAEVQPNSIVATRRQKSFDWVDSIVEKPTSDTGERLCDIGYYIFNTDVFDIIAAQKPHPRTHEIGLYDTIDALCRTKPVVAYRLRGRWLDCGTPETWLSSQNFMAKHARS